MGMITDDLTRYKVVLIKDNSERELFASYSKTEAINKAKHLANQNKWSKRYNLTRGEIYKIQVLDDDQNEYLTKSYLVK